MSLRSIAALLAISLVWGFYYLAVDSLLESGWSNEWMNALRFLLGGGILIMVAFAGRRGGELISLQINYFKEILLISWIGIFLGMYLLTESQERVPSGVTGTLSSMIIIFIALLTTTRFFGARTIARKEWLGLLLGFLGAVLIYNPWQESNIDLLGFIFVITGSLFIALEALFVSKWFSEKNPLLVVSLVTLWAGIGFFLLALVLGKEIQTGDWALLLLLALGSNVLIFMLYFWLIAKEGPVFANISSYLIPAIALLAGILLNDEPFTYFLIAGALACIAGALLVGEEESIATKSD